MPDANATLEARVELLEKQVAELMDRILKPPPEKDWRSTIGMFGRKIREAEREQARRDHS